jgi:hypothetical protein
VFWEWFFDRWLFRVVKAVLLIYDKQVDALIYIGKTLRRVGYEEDEDGYD